MIAFCERLIGTIRRECLDWLIIGNEQYWRSILKEWVIHYNRGRPHASLGPGIPDVPCGEAEQPSHGHRIPEAIASSRFRFWRGCTTNTGWNQKPPELHTASICF